MKTNLVKTLLWLTSLLNCRNKSIENVITIDLHGQHIKQAMKLLKLHLLFGAYVRCKNLPLTGLVLFQDLSFEELTSSNFLFLTWNI